MRNVGQVPDKARVLVLFHKPLLLRRSYETPIDRNKKQGMRQVEIIIIIIIIMYFTKSGYILFKSNDSYYRFTGVYRTKLLQMQIIYMN
jgi:hypothetical protein